jgi:tetratricopeptide (TPR) repeat protein
MGKWIIIIVFLIPLFTNAQNNARIKKTKEVFDKLVQAFANGKGAPDLKIVPTKEKQVIAEYSTTSQGLPLIKIDQKLINICFSLGKDSLNALAFILSHELSHYFKDDNWCMDYAGLKFKTNPAFAKAIKNGENYNIGKEAGADKEGLVYSSIAGYSPFKIFNRLIDSVYSKYKLQSNLLGYPSKSRRKEINEDAVKQAQRWLSIFNLSIKLINEGKYESAIDSLIHLSQKFPSREVYNNLGVARVRKALLLKPKTSEEVNSPDRFLYPIEIENKTRLSQEDTRGIDENSYEEMTNQLMNAQKNFQEAIRIDPQFFKGYINLACVYDLLDKPVSAIGEIFKLTKEQQNIIEAKRILAIAYYHNNEENKAELIWNEIGNRNQ